MSGVRFPLVFTFHDLIVGRGFVAGVELAGRALLVEEEEGSWLYGVTPGGLAACGHEKAETLSAFRNRYRAVLQDLAAAAAGFEAFAAAVARFQSEESDVEEWAAAVVEVRSSGREVDWVRAGDADAHRGVVVTDLTLQLDPGANPSPFDEVALARCA